MLERVDRSDHDQPRDLTPSLIDTVNQQTEVLRIPDLAKRRLGPRVCTGLTQGSPAQARGCPGALQLVVLPDKGARLGTVDGFVRRDSQGSP